MDSRKENYIKIENILKLVNDIAELLCSIEQELEQEKNKIYSKWYIALLPADWRPKKGQTNINALEDLNQLKNWLLQFSQKATCVYIKVNEPLDLVEYDNLKNIYAEHICWKWIDEQQDIYDLLKIRELSEFISEVQLTLHDAAAEEEKLVKQQIPFNLSECVRKND
ncbi:MAG: hypothetical protein ACI4C1_05420 [Lachnospiraceae bacterium]